MTFINQIHWRSLKAHQKLDLTIIDELEFDRGSYYSLAFLIQTNSN
ncbi:MAG: hypothetical protein AAFO95_02435 [Cyanobacteria bacterium J06600_6]